MMMGNNFKSVLEYEIDLQKMKFKTKSQKLLLVEAWSPWKKSTSQKKK